MSSDLTETFSIPTPTSSSQSNALQFRTEDLKQSLAVWRSILVPLNNLLEWEHQYDPLIIVGVLTFIFGLLHQVNPSVLTFISCLMLIFVLVDLLGLIGIGRVYLNEQWTSMSDAKYTRLCERIAYLEQRIKYRSQSVMRMRQETPGMYLMLAGIFLLFLAFCCQRVDNFLLVYLTMLILCLLPGIRNRQLMQSLRQIITDLWNSKKNISSSEMNKSKMQ